MVAAVNNGQPANLISRLWRRVRMNPTLEWGCEISPSGVALARWNGGGADSGGMAWRPLPPGTIDVSPLRENLLHPEEVRQALEACLESLGRSVSTQSSSRTIDIALVIPDQAARVFFASFDQFPNQPSQAISLIRWKLKKSVPFDIDAATVSYVAHPTGAEWDVLVVVLPAAIVQQYEALAQGLGLQPRFVTLSTLGSLGLAPAGDSTSDSPATSASFLLAKFSPPWLTTAILHENSVRLFRTVHIVLNGSSGSSEDFSREILEALHPSAAYFQDNFGRPLEKAYLCGLGGLTGVVADSLSEELNLRAMPLVEGAVTPVSGMESGQADRNLAALMGIANMRRRT